MNDLMSLGIHRLWKRFTIEMCGLREGHVVLDLAGGTGDLALRMSRMVGPAGEVVALGGRGRDRVEDGPSDAHLAGSSQNRRHDVG